MISIKIRIIFQQGNSQFYLHFNDDKKCNTGPDFPAFFFVLIYYLGNQAEYFLLR